jgi:hypothetical protein
MEIIEVLVDLVDLVAETSLKSSTLYECVWLTADSQEFVVGEMIRVVLVHT